jgi:hypothetical protein
MWRISLIIDDEPGQIGKNSCALGNMNVGINNLKTMGHHEDDRLSIILIVDMPTDLKMDDVKP